MGLDTAIVTTILVAACTIGYGEGCLILHVIIEDNVELLVDGTIVDTVCVKCFDADTIWTLPDGTILNDNPRDEVRVQDHTGYLAFCPMRLLMDGPDSFRVDCQSHSNTTLALMHTNIQIYSSTFLPPVLSSPVLTVSEGEDVQEACLNLNPAPLIPSTENAQQWLDPSGNSALAQSNVLTILNITHFQAGEYRCVLTSIRDSTTSATLTITVQYAPTITPENNTLLKLHPNTAASVSCGFDGEPQPNIAWSHDGNTTEGRGTATTVTTSNRSMLTVHEVTSGTEGIYRCSARNSEGNSSAEFRVRILPDPVTGLTTSFVSDTTATLHWTEQSVSSGDVEVDTWTSRSRVGTILLVGGVASTMISSLQPLTNYTFTVYVVTSVGRSEPASLHVFTLSLPQPDICIFLSMSSTELFLAWKLPTISPYTTDPITSWNIELSMSSEDRMQRLTQGDTHTTNTTFRGLEAGTEYRVRVAAENSRGTGVFSKTATATTQLAPLNSAVSITNIALIVVIVVLLTASPLPAVLVCLLKRKPQKTKQLPIDPTTFTHCAAYDSPAVVQETDYECIATLQR